MQTILYTDTDQVRSVFGVDSKDMPDATITGRNPEKELRLDLASWLPTHGTIYNAGMEAAATDEEVQLSDALNLYSTYFCCDLVVGSVQMAAPQAVSDGKNSMNRFTPMDWQRIEDRIKGKLATYKQLLQELTSASVESAGFAMFSGVGLALDPVTEVE